VVSSVASVASVTSGDVSSPDVSLSSLVHAAPSSASAINGTSARRVVVRIGSPIRVAGPAMLLFT
jgi:hypothetical protein